MLENVGTVVAQASKQASKQFKPYIQFFKFYPAPFYCEVFHRSRKVRGLAQVSINVIWAFLFLFMVTLLKIDRETVPNGRGYS